MSVIIITGMTVIDTTTTGVMFRQAGSVRLAGMTIHLPVAANVKKRGCAHRAGMTRLPDRVAECFFPVLLLLRQSVPQPGALRIGPALGLVHYSSGIFHPFPHRYCPHVRRGLVTIVADRDIHECAGGNLPGPQTPDEPAPASKRVFMVG
ncbi:hypothetical protein, partial [Rivihabitans pingtungensis]|uniref:hypothetical protein n=1 Tax=Rivihabitans pingtungensis TaxID=1054498 RepID=UPI002B7823E7